MIPPRWMNSEAPLLEFDEVMRSYGVGQRQVDALGPLSLGIGAGEFVAIMGPSGSGKSTLLALAGALDEPTSGEVRIQGRVLGSLSRAERAALRRRSVGFVFQDLNLLPGLTALENVALPLELDGVRLREARNASREALDRVQLSDLAGRFPDDLSGGERQRVAIARAFVGQRELLLADEPTGALDSVTGEWVMRLMRKHSELGRTVVLVTHDISHAAWADRVLYLRDGRLVENGASSVPPSTAERGRGGQ